MKNANVVMGKSVLKQKLHLTLIDMSFHNVVPFHFANSASNRDVPDEHRNLEFCCVRFCVVQPFVWLIAVECLLWRYLKMIEILTG